MSSTPSEHKDPLVDEKHTQSNPKIAPSHAFVHHIPKIRLLGLIVGVIVFYVLANIFRVPLRSQEIPPRDHLCTRPGTNAVNLVDQVANSSWSSNGRTDEVAWDRYSLVIRGQRIFLHSGELHTFRLPVPSLWPDILEKMKAAGLNAVSLYTHMGLINPAPGVIDLDGFRALEPFFEACANAGLWLVLRPGPYINAETTAGGIAHWVTSEVAGELRTNATDFHEAWRPYIRAIIGAATHHQVTYGGPIIAIQLDNEYPEGDWGHGGAEFIEQLKQEYHKSGIVVPLTYNDPGQRKTFVNGTGAADIYGFDEYPQRFDCSKPDVWNPVVTNYHDYHQNTNPSQPLYSPEFQAGAFDPWGPHAPGYEACRKLTGSDFQSVFYLSLWAANAKLVNYYMIFGGTSWGNIPFPGVYTSYDYGAPISETRELTSKYPELKRQGLFLRSSPEFYKTNWMGNNTGDAVRVSDARALVVWLRNPDTSANFYIVRQNDSTSLDTIKFQMNLDTSDGVKVPSYPIILSGRQAKVIVTDYAYGSSRLLYSTAQVLFAGKIGERDVLFVHGDIRHTHEVLLPLHGNSFAQTTSSDNPKILRDTAGKYTRVTILPGVEGLIALRDSPSELVLYADSESAGTFWAPPLSFEGDTRPFTHFWGHGTNATLLVGGPYLVRSATLGADGVLALRGDLVRDVRLFLFAPPEVQRVTWNGMLVVPDLAFDDKWVARGGFVGQLRFGQDALVSPIEVPELTGWRYADSLPEIVNAYDDSKWTIADYNTTDIPFKPHYGDGRVLYGCDYSFCEGVVIWRGSFESTGSERSVNLSINGGEAFAASVWLNDVFLRTTYGNSSNNLNIIDETDEVYIFPEEVIRPGTNVITIVQDNMGLDETDAHPDSSKSPRGVRGFQLNGGSNEFTTWKVQGKVGGYYSFPDKTRGILNEGGLFAERAGWHLPGFDVSSWEHRAPVDGLPSNNAGIGFFVTTFELHIPEGYDVPISFVFEDGESGEETPYRALLFVNGWNFGKRIANLGPQFKFPVPQGILDYDGVNTVALALWAMESTRVAPRLALRVEGVYDSALGLVEPNNPVWSAAGRESA